MCILVIKYGSGLEDIECLFVLVNCVMVIYGVNSVEGLNVFKMFFDETDEFIRVVFCILCVKMI